MTSQSPVALRPGDVRAVATFFHCSEEWQVKGVLNAGFFKADVRGDKGCPLCGEESHTYMAQAGLPTFDGENHD